MIAVELAFQFPCFNTLHLRQRGRTGILPQMSISPRSPIHPPSPDCPTGRTARLPQFTKGMRIGIFGGTFNPPHEGHRLVSLTALKRQRLDAVWWLVTPGNPLKENSGLPPLSVRMQAAQKIASHPKITITSFEAEIGTRYTYDTISYLRARCPGVHFVWLMGADNLASFHRWQNWKGIARLMPLAVIDRPRSTLRAVNSPAGHFLARRRVSEHAAAALVTRDPPAFIFLHGPRSDLSSTELRARGITPQDALTIL